MKRRKTSVGWCCTITMIDPRGGHGKSVDEERQVQVSWGWMFVEGWVLVGAQMFSIAYNGRMIDRNTDIQIQEGYLGMTLGKTFKILAKD